MIIRMNKLPTFLIEEQLAHRKGGLYNIFANIYIRFQTIFTIQHL